MNSRKQRLGGKGGTQNVGRQNKHAKKKGDICKGLLASKETVIFGGSEPCPVGYERIEALTSLDMGNYTGD